MKLPGWLKLPKLKFRLPRMKWFERKSPTLSGVWKRFCSQVPPDSRSILSSNQHFLVLGAQSSGKTELIEGLIAQSQDLFPFETTFTDDPNVQYYLGPKQVIHELAFETIANRSIRVRKQVIRLWKQLFAKRDPIVIITYNCCDPKSGDLRETGQTAQYVAGKLSLLSEIRKQPIKVRLALTHLDKIDGYLELARFLKQQNITFNVSLNTQFESGIIQKQFGEFYDKYLSLMLTTMDYADYMKALSFLTKISEHFDGIEEFLRALAARVRFKGSMELDLLSFTSSLEPNSAYSPFDWSKAPSAAIFFKYPMLKHQIGSACLLLLTILSLSWFYAADKTHLNYLRAGIDHIDLLQINDFQHEVLPSLADFSARSSGKWKSMFIPHFFRKSISKDTKILSDQIRKYIIEPEYRRMLLQSQAEFRHIYFLGLMHATSNNKLGKIIMGRVGDWARVLNLDEELITTYVRSCSQPANRYETVNLSKINPSLPLTSLEPWKEILQEFQEIVDQPVFIDQGFEGMREKSDRLLKAVNRLRSDPLVATTATKIDEEGYADQLTKDCAENIKTLRWLHENLDNMEEFLHLISRTSVVKPDVEGMNVSQFYVKVKEISALADIEGQTYNFSIDNKVHSFDSKDWIQLVVTHNVEKAIQNYIMLNSDTGGQIFFRHVAAAEEPVLPQLESGFPYFRTKIKIPGRYARQEFEKKVRQTAEKLSYLIDSLPINPEEKNRFSFFLTREVTSYIKKYQSEYVDWFQNCGIRVQSLKQVNTILTDLRTRKSSFSDFLHSILYHTTAFSEPSPCLKDFKDLNEFDFLRDFLKQQEDHPPFAEYQQLMGEIQDDLNGLTSEGILSGYSFLEPHLTPAARISLHILREDPQSYVLRTKALLTDLEVPEKYHAPFIRPVEGLYQFGLVDLKNTVEYLWNSELMPKIKQVFAKFPFNPKGEQVATFAEVKAALCPTDTNWSCINQIIRACGYHKSDGKYVCTGQNLPLDPEIYDKLNSLARVTSAFWDDEGIPRPITFKVQPIPFEPVLDVTTIPECSHLTVGDKAYTNFNQNPSWQEVEVEWWHPQNVTVALELRNRHTNATSQRVIPVVNTEWGFFELLKKGSHVGDNVWEWNLSKKRGGDPRKVRFRFDSNPQEVFNLWDY